MALILKGGAIFLHIPKTGGSWVTKVLKESGLVDGKIGHKHADMAHLYVSNNKNRFRSFIFRIKKSLGFYPQNPFIFCFVRHPLSWYESWFKYMSQPDQNWRNWGNNHDPNQWHPNAVLNGLGNSDFNQFLRNVTIKHPGYVSEMYSWYTEPHINFIGKQEHLHDDLIQVLNLLNLNYDEDFIRNYSPVNKSKVSKASVEWDPELIEEVSRLETAGITRYGYEPFIGNRIKTC